MSAPPQGMIDAILSLGRHGMVHEEQAEAIALRMMASDRTLEAFVECVRAEDPVAWIPLGLAERIAAHCLPLAGDPLPSPPSP